VETATITAVAQIMELLRASPDLGDALGGVVRLAFHDAGSWDGSTGGADGCVDLDAAENAGLEPIIEQLTPIVASVSGVLSRADIWTLAGNVAVEMAGGPAMDFEVGRMQKAARDMGSAFLMLSLGRHTSATSS
jgi:catalase (peroxidase I)